jgi:nucleoside-diphosphate-sugar epimerase
MRHRSEHPLAECCIQIDSCKFSKMRVSDPAISPGSTVVVIGANGYMAVEVCDKLLEAGYNVRGTVRDVEKHSEVRLDSSTNPLEAA